MKNILVPLALAASVALSGCVTSNIHNSQAMADIDSTQDARSAIRKGMTQDQVATRMGKPTSTYERNGEAMWMYNYRTTSFKGKNAVAAALGGAVLPDTRTMTVTFNTAGRVKRVDYTNQSY